MSKMLYLDYAATTPVDRRVIEAMTDCLGLDGAFGNPSSTHAIGTRAERLVAEARERIARLVGVEPDRITFTSGATESNNLALKGVLAASGARRHLITTRIEHKSVIDTARALAALGADRGAKVTFLECDREGIVSAGQVDAAITEETALVSVMHVNNEIGVVEDIAGIARVCRERGVLLHVDAAQSTGKIPLDLAEYGIDLCSLTAHKMNGPKGIGALYVRRGVTVLPLLHGGEQEGGLRPGTLATHQIVGMGKTFELADPEREGARLAALRDALWRGLEAIGGAVRNGSVVHAAPHILNVSFPGIDGESLRLGLADIAVSQGSACASSVPEPSHVLSALGLSDQRAQSTLRLSVGRFTSDSDVDYAVRRVGAEVARLRGLANSAPGWCSA